MGFFGSLLCCFPQRAGRNKGRSSDNQSNSEENSLLNNQASSSNHNRNQDNTDTNSITSFGNTDVNGGKGYGATGQDGQRQREEDERERDERERERLNAIAGQAGNRMLSLNRPSSPLTNHTRSPQSSRPASPTLQTQDETSVHSADLSTHAQPLNAVRQVNLGLARTTSSSSGRGKRGSGISGRKSTSLRRKEVRPEAEDTVEAPAPVKVDSPKKSLVLGPQVSAAADGFVAQPSVKEDPTVVEASTSATREREEALGQQTQIEAESTTILQPPSPEKTEAASEEIAGVSEQESTSAGIVEAESALPIEQVSTQQQQPSQSLSTESTAQHTDSTQTTSHAQPHEPVISYAAVAAAPTESSTHDQEPSKLGLDLHGHSIPAESQPSVATSLDSVENGVSEPSFADVAAPAATSDQADSQPTPEDSTTTDVDANAADDVTPPNEVAEIDDEASPSSEQKAGTSEAGAGKSGKGKGKGKGGKNKNKAKQNKRKK